MDSATFPEQFEVIGESWRRLDVGWVYTCSYNYNLPAWLWVRSRLVTMVSSFIDWLRPQTQ